jgi:hypothetical protein
LYSARNRKRLADGLSSFQGSFAEPVVDGVMQCPTGDVHAAKLIKGGGRGSAVDLEDRLKVMEREVTQLKKALKEANEA